MVIPNFLVANNLILALSIFLITLSISTVSPALAGTSPARQCMENMQTLKKAVENYDRDSGWVRTLEPERGYIPPEELLSRKYLESEPRCPDRPGGHLYIRGVDPELRSFKIICPGHGDIEEASQFDSKRAANKRHAILIAAALLILAAIPLLLRVSDWKKKKSDIKVLSKSFLIFHVFITAIVLFYPSLFMFDRSESSRLINEVCGILTNVFLSPSWLLVSLFKQLSILDEYIDFLYMGVFIGFPLNSVIVTWFFKFMMLKVYKPEDIPRQSAEAAASRLPRQG